MQTALDVVFVRLAEIFKTAQSEIAKNVVRDAGEYHEIARNTMIDMFTSMARAIENRTNLANSNGAALDQKYPIEHWTDRLAGQRGRRTTFVGTFVIHSYH
jgi:hypothetical protein